MRRKFPKTLAFLNFYEELLRSCALLKQFFDPLHNPFYSVYNVGNYTLSPYKILWSQVANSLNVLVVSELPIPETRIAKIAVPDHSLCSISFYDYFESHYVAACLNNSISRWIVENYIAIHPSPNIMEYLPIERYDASEKIHHQLSQLSIRCHEATANGNEKNTRILETKIDKLVAKLWGLPSKGLQAIQGEF